MYPSVKAIRQAFGQRLMRGYATRIRRIMEDSPNTPGALARIDNILGTHGVEYIQQGHDSKSPAILYCNAGDAYSTTIMKVNGRFRIGCWGDIVERGSYE